MSTSTLPRRTARDIQMNTGNTRAQGQIAKANELLAEVAEVNGEYANQVWSQLKARWAANTCTFEFVSAQISALIDAKKASAKLAETPNLPDVPAGRYAVTGGDGATKFYRVGRDKKGALTLFVYASDTQHPITVVRTIIAILAQIANDGVEAAQLRWGREIGRCFTCGRVLTDEVSRERGQGPDCYSK
jgi:hypothetical protein